MKSRTWWEAYLAALPACLEMEYAADKEYGKRESMTTDLSRKSADERAVIRAGKIATLTTEQYEV